MSGKTKPRDILFLLEEKRACKKCGEEDYPAFQNNTKIRCMHCGSTWREPAFVKNRVILSPEQIKKYGKYYGQ